MLPQLNYILITYWYLQFLEKTVATVRVFTHILNQSRHDGSSKRDFIYLTPNAAKILLTMPKIFIF